MSDKDLKHYGVLGMKWGKHRNERPAAIAKRNKLIPNLARNVGLGFVPSVTQGAKGLEKIRGALSKLRKPEDPMTKQINDEANKILNNPKSSKEDINKALKSIGVDPVSGKFVKTDPVYNKDGNDVSVNPVKRLFKEKGQSDKDFDAMVDAEMNPPKEKLVGKPVKTLFGVRTEPVYVKNGNDISSKPFGRPFKKKGQSDKDFDAEIDAGNSDSPDAIAKRKVSDIQMDKQAKIQMAVALGAAATVTVAMYFAKKSLGEAAKAAIIKKYGPALAKQIIEMRGL